jgi:hypothetical protein
VGRRRPLSVRQASETEIESLKLLMFKLKRMQFGPRSEKFTRDIEQTRNCNWKTCKRKHASGR